jgi:hypothetical protein
MRYVNIKTAGPNAYTVWVCRDGAEAPVIREGRRVDYDRKLVGMRTKVTYRRPVGPPGTFTRDEAIHVAHHVGLYDLQFGDLVWTYAFVDGLQSTEFFRR